MQANYLVQIYLVSSISKHNVKIMTIYHHNKKDKLKMNCLN